MQTFNKVSDTESSESNETPRRVRMGIRLDSSVDFAIDLLRIEEAESGALRCGETQGEEKTEQSRGERISDVRRFD